jgi:recombination protein RecA
MARKKLTGEAPEPKHEDDLPPLMDVVKDVLGKKMAKVGGHVGTAEELEYLHKPSTHVKTGIYGLDLILSRGLGIPSGRIIEVSAPESVGKTALCEYLMGRGKRVGAGLHYIETEMTRDDSHLGCYGVEPKDVLTPDVPDLEATWDYIRGLVDILSKRRAAREKAGDAEHKDPPQFVFFDSLAATAARAELNEDEHGDKHMAEQARSNAKGCRVTVRELSKSSVIFVCVNQIRDKPGAQGYGPKTDTPGGRALKFAYSIRLKMALIKTLKKGDAPVGHIIEVTTLKNKHAPKGMKCRIVLSYYRGIDANWSNFLWFQENKMIVPAGGAGFTWKGGDGTKFRRKDFSEWVRDHRVEVQAAIKSIYEKTLAAGGDDDGAQEDE